MRGLESRGPGAGLDGRQAGAAARSLMEAQQERREQFSQQARSYRGRRHSG